MADYRAMWEGLGMDVNTHDLLCEALPQAFGDVYLSQGNRPWERVVATVLDRVRQDEGVEP